MKLSKKKARVRIHVSDGYQTFESGDLIGKYNDEGMIIISSQGIYDIYAGVMVVEKKGNEYCLLVILEADDDIFLTDETILDIKDENS